MNSSSLPSNLTRLARILSLRQQDNQAPGSYPYPYNPQQQPGATAQDFKHAEASEWRNPGVIAAVVILGLAVLALFYVVLRVSGLNMKLWRRDKNHA